MHTGLTGCTGPYGRRTSLEGGGRKNENNYCQAFIAATLVVVAVVVVVVVVVVVTVLCSSLHVISYIKGQSFTRRYL